VQHFIGWCAPCVLHTVMMLAMWWICLALESSVFSNDARCPASESPGCVPRFKVYACVTVKPLDLGVCLRAARACVRGRC